LQSLSGHQSPVECVSFDNAEEVVVAGAQGGTVKLWDLEQAKGHCLSVAHSCCIIASTKMPPWGWHCDIKQCSLMSQRCLRSCVKLACSNTPKPACYHKYHSKACQGSEATHCFLCSDQNVDRASLKLSERGLPSFRRLLCIRISGHKPQSLGCQKEGLH